MVGMVIGTGGGEAKVGVCDGDRAPRPPSVMDAGKCGFWSVASHPHVSLGIVTCQQVSVGRSIGLFTLHDAAGIYIFGVEKGAQMIVH